MAAGDRRGRLVETGGGDLLEIGAGAEVGPVAGEDDRAGRGRHLVEGAVELVQQRPAERVHGGVLEHQELDAVRHAYDLLHGDICAACPRRGELGKEVLYYMI